ncbi:MAG: alanine--tRNA ligase [Acidimicrobiales bacterium]
MMTASELREAFTTFFVERGHRLLAPASLLPNDPTVLFTIAGMVQFKPYFLGEGEPPAARVTTVQPCLRTTDIELVGTTPRHCTFFEMLGNFSFGDYFKQEAIPWAWEFVTEVLGFDPALLWATVHVSDDEATEIWPSTTSLPPERLQRLDEDNFWKMGDTGPCGPSSEIFFDRGDAFGPGGGPAQDASDRYTEIWNLVFTELDRRDDGTLVALPRHNIDTGAGLDRLLAVIQGVPDVQAIDIVAPIVEAAAALTGKRIGVDQRTDESLRIMADHCRAFSFAIADGAFPSNEGRGYVLRRLIRRCVLRAQRLGRIEACTPELVDAVTACMGDAYPYLLRDSDRIKKVALHEEEAFMRTLRQGTALLSAELSSGAQLISGEVAFKLHDTFGFPFEMTREEALERGVEVDEAGFEAEMASQRRRARQAAVSAMSAGSDLARSWRQLRAEHGPTEFLGYSELASEAHVLAVLEAGPGEQFSNVDGEGPPSGSVLVEVYLDRTPFYAEGGGQVGDTGLITTAGGKMRVLDATAVADGLIRHVGYMEAGEIAARDEALAEVDADRRDALRRNHTGTHLLHAALRKVLGDHVRQQGSLITADHLRFDFSHFGPLSKDEAALIEDLVNAQVLADQAVVTTETTRENAKELGAIAFFGEKYGEHVRVVRAGSSSLELCGGTHVATLGMIGPLWVTSESSIGANTRRVECVTGTGAFASFRDAQRTLFQAAELLHSSPGEVADAVGRSLQHLAELESELAHLKGERLSAEAARLAEDAVGGVVVARFDGLDQDEMRQLGLSVRDRPGIRSVGLVGATGGGKAALIVAVRADSGLDARRAASEAGRLLGGGGGGSSELATAGGRDLSGIDAALSSLRERLR